MTSEESINLIESLLNDTLWSFYLKWVLPAFISALVILIIAYLKEKGKNKAILEDIENITRKVEGVKNQFTMLLQDRKEKQQLRFAAIETRLQKHQEAYALWRKLVRNTHYRENLSKVLIECDEWWDNNCLYLSNQPRESFKKAVFCASIHRDLVEVPHPDRDVDEIKRNWEELQKAGQDILTEMNLPPLSEIESKYIEEDKEHNKAVVWNAEPLRSQHPTP